MSKKLIRITESELQGAVMLTALGYLKEHKFPTRPVNESCQNKRLTRGDVGRIIRESIINETSYDLARRAHKKAQELKKYDQAARLHKHLCDKASERFDPNKKVRVIGGPQQGEYKAGDLEKYFEIRDYDMPSTNSLYTDSPCIGYPRLYGYVGPMASGDAIEYMTQEAYNTYSI